MVWNIVGAISVGRDYAYVPITSPYVRLRSINSQAQFGQALVRVAFLDGGVIDANLSAGIVQSRVLSSAPEYTYVELGELPSFATSYAVGIKRVVPESEFPWNVEVSEWVGDDQPQRVAAVVTGVSTQILLPNRFRRQVLVLNRCNGSVGFEFGQGVDTTTSGALAPSTGNLVLDPPICRLGLWVESANGTELAGRLIVQSF